MTIHGESQQVLLLEAIVLHLMQKALTGDTRAWRALLKYFTFANSRSAKPSELSFANNEYSSDLAKLSLESDNVGS